MKDSELMIPASLSLAHCLCMLQISFRFLRGVLRSGRSRFISTHLTNGRLCQTDHGLHADGVPPHRDPFRFGLGFQKLSTKDNCGLEHAMMDPRMSTSRSQSRGTSIFVGSWLLRMTPEANLFSIVAGLTM